MSQLGVGDALAVGFAQVLALVPGSSRSGSTIMAGLFAGETRETAARFSFLLSMPAIAASGALELNEAIDKLPDAASPLVGGDDSFRCDWLRLDLVFVEIFANALHGSVHCLSPDRGADSLFCVGRGVIFQRQRIVRGLWKPGATLPEFKRYQKLLRFGYTVRPLFLPDPTFGVISLIQGR